MLQPQKRSKPSSSDVINPELENCTPDSSTHEPDVSVSLLLDINKSLLLLYRYELHILLECETSKHF